MPTSRASRLSRLARLLAAALAGGTAAAVAVPAADALGITVHQDRYVVAGWAVDDLDRLEAAVRALAPRAVRLQVCHSQATRAFKAAVHRFRALPQTTLVMSAADPQCLAPAAPVLQRVVDGPAAAPRGIDDAAVDRYWDTLMP